MEEKTNGIKKLFESDKARKIIVIIGIIGIALIFISSISGINTDKKTETEGFSVTTYSTEIESDLQKILSSISGCGETKVLLTIENSVEYVYLEDSTTKTKEIQPVIRGVLVVCEGGDDPGRNTNGHTSGNKGTGYFIGKGMCYKINRTKVEVL